MKIEKLVLMSGLLCSICSSGVAQGLITDRTALNALLGTYRVDEGFETYPVNGGVGSDGLLSSTNNWGGDGGYNLVAPGVTFESTGVSGNYSIQWAGSNFGPGTTKTISAGVGIKLDFWSTITAFGIDLKDYPSMRTVLTTSITVYGADDTTVLYSGTYDITDPANGTFFGFQNSGEIGSVVFSDAVTGPYWNNMSPFIDNLSFGVVPEPSTITFALLGLGALTWRFRKK